MYVDNMIGKMTADGKSVPDILIELRTETGMNRKSFAEYLQIPYRTLTDWERGQRNMPSYVLRMIAYLLKTENLIQ